MKRETALIQHPMYLLIREDSTCAERTPPWGEQTIELYIERTPGDPPSSEHGLNARVNALTGAASVNPQGIQ